MTDLLRTHEAAELAGITPAAFRKAAANDPTLREAKTMLDARTPAYPRTAVEAWRASTPRRIVRGSAVLLAVLAAFALSGCGQEAAGEPDSAVQVSASAEAQAPVAEPVESETVEVPLGESGEVADGAVDVMVVAGSESGTYAVQVQASPSLDGSWTVPVDQIVGVAADGSEIPVESSQWPANPTVTSANSIVGGTVTFAQPVTAIRYAASDGSVVDWAVS